MPEQKALPRLVLQSELHAHSGPVRVRHRQQVHQAPAQPVQGRHRLGGGEPQTRIDGQVHGPHDTDGHQRHDARPGDRRQRFPVPVADERGQRFPTPPADRPGEQTQDAVRASAHRPREEGQGGAAARGGRGREGDGCVRCARPDLSLPARAGVRRVRR